MTAPDLCTDLPRLVLISAAALVSGDLVRITHPPGWRRPACWPTPAANIISTITATGHRTCEYRPITLLIYVEKSARKPTSKPSKPSKTKPETQLQIHA